MFVRYARADEMVTRDDSRAQVGDGLAAELAAISVAREQERVRDLPAEPARHVDELRQPDDRRPRQREPLGPHGAGRIGLDDFRLAVDDEA
jgi:hypothetical protein